LALLFTGTAEGQTTAPATQPGDASVPATPTVTKITRRSTSKTVRVMFDANPTPIPMVNPNYTGKNNEEYDAKGQAKWVRWTDSTEYMRQMGLTPSFMVYDGTENRAPMWCDEWGNLLTLKPAGNRFDVDWSREGNFSSPLSPRVARAASLLAKKPSTYGAKLPPYMALILDIEGSPNIYNAIGHGHWNQKPSGLLKVIKAWEERFWEYRKNLGDIELYCYMHAGFAGFLDTWSDGRWDREEIAARNALNNGWNLPDDQRQALYKAWQDASAEITALGQIKEADQKAMRLLSGYSACFYNWDVTVENPGKWFSIVDQADSSIERHYPYFKHSKWATVCITYDVYWPGSLVNPANAAKNGKLVPQDLFSDQVKYLVERGWNIYLWIPSHSLKNSRWYIDEVARYSPRTPIAQ
jgi:hypothetical protein